MPLGPANARPCDRGHVAAMLAGHMEIPLVAVEIGRLDAGMAFQCGRGDHVNLAPPPEGGRALDGQIDGVALTIGIAGIAVHLVEEQISHRCGSKSDGAVRPGHHQLAAGEGFAEQAVPGVPRSRSRHQVAQGWGGLDQRIDPHGRVAPHHVERRHDQHGDAGGVLDDVAEPIQSGLGPSCLRALHQHDPLIGAGGGQGVHHGA
ncbi:hypothetical protein ROA7023_04716 [Roseisalinus antarcticus]|uniref:Uncharacterized protein n=1 Tax=Roseisalinus antarcticus TaxID=254357 RepID=A0A1Y5U437_9RHOB|nr:hypothetical protein ROA7023_04716 [Roseisalinus antarcticus]